MRLLKALLTALVGNTFCHGASIPPAQWVGSFMTAPQYQVPNITLPPAEFASANGYFSNTTIRQTFRLRLGADSYRLNISNIYGLGDLPLTSVTVGITAPNATGATLGQPNVTSGTLKQVTFNGSNSYTIPPGEVVVSDPVSITLCDNTDMTVSIYSQEGQQGSGFSVHSQSFASSWLSHGDHTNAESLPSSKVEQTHWYFVTSVQAQLDPSYYSTLVCIGDSITDGVGSGLNANNDWVDDLAARLLNASATTNISALNAGIGGNHLVSTPGTGTPAVDRIDRDVLSQPGVKYVFILEGINDIGHCANDTEAIDQLYHNMTAAYTSIIDRVHSMGLPIFAGTIMPDYDPPYSGLPGPYYTPLREKLRLRVNDWITNSSKFDCVIDYSSAVANVTNPKQISNQYAWNNYLHPNAQGHLKLANTWDLSLFAKFANGV